MSTQEPPYRQMFCVSHSFLSAKIGEQIEIPLLSNIFYILSNMFDVENPDFKTRVLTDFTLDTLPALVTFTVVASYGVHTSPTIHTHVHVAFIDI